MKKYKVIDCQDCNFMDDTHDTPMTMNALRSRFWSLDDCRSNTYAQFTRNYIGEIWAVEFKLVIKVGQKIWWDDPKFLSSGAYQVTKIVNEDVCIISNRTSEAEVYIQDIR